MPCVSSTPSRAGQHHVHQHQVGPDCADAFHRAGAVALEHQLDVLTRERHRDQLVGELVVLDHQHDRRGRGAAFAAAGAGCAGAARGAGGGRRRGAGRADADRQPAGVELVGMRQVVVERRRRWPGGSPQRARRRVQSDEHQRRRLAAGRVAQGPRDALVRRDRAEAEEDDRRRAVSAAAAMIASSGPVEIATAPSNSRPRRCTIACAASALSATARIRDVIFRRTRCVCHRRDCRRRAWRRTTHARRGDRTATLLRWSRRCPLPSGPRTGEPGPGAAARAQAAADRRRRSRSPRRSGRAGRVARPAAPSPDDLRLAPGRRLTHKPRASPPARRP